jgi:hypothetical protein
MPLRLPDAPPAAAIDRWAAAGGAASKETLGLVYAFGAASPPGACERLMAACYGIGEYRGVWKRGAIIETRLAKALLLIEMRAVRCEANDAGGGRGGRGSGAQRIELALELRGPRSRRSDLWGLLLVLKQVGARHMRTSSALWPQHSPIDHGSHGHWRPRTRTARYAHQPMHASPARARLTRPCTRALPRSQRADELLSEWSEYASAAELLCPRCLTDGHEPCPRWPADAAARAREDVPIVPTCPRCEHIVDLVGLQPTTDYPEEALSLTMPADAERAVPPNPAPLKLGQPLQAACSLHLVLGLEKKRLQQILARDTAGRVAVRAAPPTRRAPIASHHALLHHQRSPFPPRPSRLALPTSPFPPRPSRLAVRTLRPASLCPPHRHRSRLAAVAGHRRRDPCLRMR